MEFREQDLVLTPEEADDLGIILYLGASYMGGSSEDIRTRWDETALIDELLSNSLVPKVYMPLLVKFGRRAVAEYDRALDDFCRDAVGDYIGHCVPGLKSRGVEALAGAQFIIERFDSQANRMTPEAEQ